jgi:cytochrome P450
MDKCVSEVDANLPPLEMGQEAYPVTLAEASLPYLRNCIKENFRVTPVFTMPLARRVMGPEGLVIAGKHIPQGVSLYPLSLRCFNRPPAGRLWTRRHGSCC